MELFAKRSILDIWQGFEYVSGHTTRSCLSNHIGIHLKQFVQWKNIQNEYSFLLYKRPVHLAQLFVLDAEMQQMLDTNEMYRYFLDQVKLILQTGDINVSYSLKLRFHLTH